MKRSIRKHRKTCSIHPAMLLPAVLLFLFEGIANEKKVPLDSTSYNHPASAPSRHRSFAFTGALRFRYEYFTNRTLKAYGAGTADDVLYERVNLGARYTTRGGITLACELYDAHFFLNHYSASDFPLPCPAQNPFDIKQLSVAMKKVGTLPVGFTLGRQVFRFGDCRIWGPGLWANAGKYTWDGMNIRFFRKTVSLHLLYGRRVITHPTRFDTRYHDYHAGGVYGIIRALPLQLEPFWVVRYEPGQSGGNDADQHYSIVNTPGVHAVDSLGSVTVRGMAAGQFGGSASKRIRAGALSMQVSNKWKVATQPHVGIEYSFASGDRDPHDDIRQTFDGAFGAAAQYYGRMNLFFLKNLHDVQVSCSFHPFPKTRIRATWDYVRLARPRDAWYNTGGKPHKVGGVVRLDTSGVSGMELGHELDFLVSSSIMPKTTLFAGICRFFPGEFIRNTAETRQQREAANMIFVQTAWKL